MSASCPHEAVGLVFIQRAVRRVAETETHPTGGAGTDEGRAFVLAIVEADIIAAGQLPYTGVVEFVAHDARFVRLREAVIRSRAAIQHAAALGHEHNVLGADAAEGDVAHRLALASPRNVSLMGKEGWQRELEADVGGIELAVFGDSYRPDGVGLLFLRCVGEIRIAETLATPRGIVEPHRARCVVAAHPEAPDPSAEIGQVPALGAAIKRPERAVVKGGCGIGIEGDRRPAARLAACGIDEVDACRAVIELAEIGAIGGAQAVDHARFEVGHVELPVPGIEGDIAEASSTVRPSRKRDVCEDLRRVAVGGIEFPDRSGTAAFAPHAR